MEYILLKIKDLKLGYTDAENYKKKEDKEFFNKIFLVDETIDEILDGGNYFIIGEKGTGKTAYAVYLSNNELKQTSADLKFIRETDYIKFVQMKTNQHLMLSDYNQIWKVILLLLVSKEIKKCINYSNPINRFVDFKKLDKAIDHYYENAFSPEILKAFEFIENSEASVQVLNKYFGGNIKGSTTTKDSSNKFQMNLFFLQQKFEDALNSIRLNKSYILFIDGIDIRPQAINHDEYLECIKGLTHAVWDINNDFLANIKGLGGKRIKIVLLMRPDIFSNMGLQNQNNKIRDNSILLDWKTTYKNYKHSNLFKMVNRLLLKQQVDSMSGKKLGDLWNYYFPYKIWNNNKKELIDSSYIDFIRHSFHRPRDVISLLDLMQQHVISSDDNKVNFTEEDFNNTLQSFSHYLLGEIKDHLLFYYSINDYELFLKFFQYLNGRMRFNYEEFISSFYKFIEYSTKNKINLPDFFESADIFLQFLYELNIICYINITDNEDFFHWCFIERSYANISPKVGSESVYQIHHGLSKSLNVGRKTHRKEKSLRSIYG